MTKTINFLVIIYTICYSPMLASIAHTAELPQFDQYCHRQAKKIIATEQRIVYLNCVNIESESKIFLAQKWPLIKKSDLENCSTSESYKDLKICLFKFRNFQ